MNINQFGIRLKIVLIAILTSFNLTFYAKDQLQPKSYFEHLSEVNKEWLSHREACPKGITSFDSDIDRIQLHLNLVIVHLKTAIPSNLNALQVSNRLSLLEKLQEYADAKVFPINTYHSIRTPYFVDAAGTNCAVGQLIYVSGHEDLVKKISKEHNYDYLEDIHTYGIQDWANEFGFTFDELKWIQPGYLPIRSIDQVLNGTNGTVKKIVKNNYAGGLIIAGDFTELDSLPCLNIGSFKNNQLSCIGNGIDGKINDAIVLSGGIYIFGEFHHNNQVFPMAKYDGFNWTYIAIPNREGATSTTGNTGGSGYIYSISISHNSIPGQQEIWHYLNNNTWEKKAKVNGIILDMEVTSFGRVHVGHFDTVIVYDANALIDTMLSVNNVVFNSNFANHWYGIGNGVSDTVNTVMNVGGAVIFGGVCSNQTGKNNVCLSRYFNSVLQPLFLNEYGPNDYSINTIAYGNGNTFSFGGNFELNQSMTSGSNLATYDLVLNQIEPMALLDHPVKSLTFYDDKLYIGGSFTKNLNTKTINYLGSMSLTLGIKESAKNTSLNVYPNPFSTTIHLEDIENGSTYSLLFIDGRIAKSGMVSNHRIDDLDFLPSGTYFLQLETKTGSFVKKILK